MGQLTFYFSFCTYPSECRVTCAGHHQTTRSGGITFTFETATPGQRLPQFGVQQHEGVRHSVRFFRRFKRAPAGLRPERYCCCPGAGLRASSRVDRLPCHHNSGEAVEFCQEARVLVESE